MPTLELPAPACPLGYPLEQIELQILGATRAEQFVQFMQDSRYYLAECTGTRYSMTSRRMFATACYGKPHGLLYYSVDLSRFSRTPPPVEIFYKQNGEEKRRWLFGDL